MELPDVASGRCLARYRKPTEKSVKFSMLRKNDLTREVTVDIGALPYSTEFDLCKETGVYQDLKKVTSTSNNSSPIPTYKALKVNCRSWLEIAPIGDGRYFLSYELNFLRGFTVSNLMGFEKLTPQRTTLSANNTVHTAEEVLEPNSKKQGGRTVESTTITISIQ